MIHTILLICLIVISAVNTCIILLQEGNENSISAITGNIEHSYMKKNARRTREFRMKALTCILSLVTLVLVLLLLIL